MLARFSICFFGLAFFVSFPTADLAAQESLDNYAYRSNTKNIFRIHDNKKLNKDEILELMVDDQLAQDKFRKSLKLRKLAWGTGIAWVAMVAYIATQEELKDNSWGDYDAGQKAVFAGFVATSAAFLGSLMGEHFVRAGSFARICFPCEAKELGQIDAKQEYISLNYSGTGINMSYHF